MIISMLMQVKLVIFSFFAGIFTGILFDLYRLMRGIKTPNKYITFVEDILFWIFTAIIIFTFLLYTNYAFIQVYVYVCIGLGLFFYLKLISPYFINGFNVIIKSIGKFARVSTNLILYPIKLIIYKLHKKNTRKNKKISWRKYKYKLEYILYDIFRINKFIERVMVFIMKKKIKVTKIMKLLLLIYVAYALISQQITMSRISGDIEVQKAQSQKLQEKNQKLQDELKRANNDDYVEKLARERLGFIKQGETTVIGNK